MAFRPVADALASAGSYQAQDMFKYDPGAAMAATTPPASPKPGITPGISGGPTGPVTNPADRLAAAIQNQYKNYVAGTSGLVSQGSPRETGAVPGTTMPGPITPTFQANARTALGLPPIQARTIAPTSSALPTRTVLGLPLGTVKTGTGGRL